jgi:hypothetical protein
VKVKDLKQKVVYNENLHIKKEKKEGVKTDEGRKSVTKKNSSNKRSGNQTLSSSASMRDL